MRTTVTLDDDVMQEIRRRMNERGASFKATVNDLLRRGLRSNDAPVADLPTFSSGQQPGVDLDKALRLATALDDEETARKIELRK